HNTETALFTGAEPNTRYGTEFFAYRYEGDPTPYVAGAGATSSANGWVRASYAISDLSAGTNYGGAEGGPVYEVKVCLTTVAGTTIACTQDSYVGFLPESLWTYHP